MKIIPQTQDEEVEVIETYSKNKLVKLTFNGVPQIIMNNKHQELIEKVVDELRTKNFGIESKLKDPLDAFIVVTHNNLQEEWLTKTLQDTIDKVLEEESERWVKAVGEKIDKTTRELMMSSFQEGVDTTKFMYEEALKALDKTPIKTGDNSSTK